MRFAFFILSAGLMTGCFTAADGQFLCDDGMCPEGMRCVARVCRINAADVDAGPTDAGPTDADSTDTGVDGGGSDSSVGDAMCTPSAEICNGVSDDCDDDIDEGTCEFPNTEATCQAEGCVVSACDNGFLDCSEGMGCETVSDRNNCGECGHVCGATEGCEAGVCVEHRLDWWWTVGYAGTVLIAAGLEQQYLLTTVNNSTVLTPSAGTPIVIDDGLGGSLLVAVDPTGEALWQVRLSGALNEVVALRSVTGVDGVYIAGQFRQGTMTADGPLTDVSLTNSGNSWNAFVLRVNSRGEVRTIYHLADLPGGDANQLIHDVSVSVTGEVFVTRP